MIPFPIAPLTALSVLITRPSTQAAELCARIEAKGGHAIALPTIAIEPVAVEIMPSPTAYDWVIFTSANAVRHGFAQIKQSERYSDSTRIAAIGKATAAALAVSDIQVDAMPQSNSKSETLLAHPALANVAQQRVLIVKGVGGRELLHDALTARGAQVDTLECYRRVPPPANNELVHQIEERWRDQGINVVTLTSVEILDNLLAMLTDSGRALLKVTPFITISERIASAARAHGLIGTCLLSRSTDDDSIIGTIAAWHARAR